MLRTCVLCSMRSPCNSARQRHALSWVVARTQPAPGHALVAERYAAKRSPYIVRVRGFGPDTASQRPLQRSATCCSRPALVPAEATNGPRTASLGRGANPSHPTSCATVRSASRAGRRHLTVRDLQRSRRLHEELRVHPRVRGGARRGRFRSAASRDHGAGERYRRAGGADARREHRRHAAGGAAVRDVVPGADGVAGVDGEAPSGRRCNELVTSRTRVRSSRWNCVMLDQSGNSASSCGQVHAQRQLPDELRRHRYGVQRIALVERSE
jgi:hypothetical protein